MGLVRDMMNALESYPANNVQLQIVEVEYPGGAINEGEEGTFRVKVSNTGPLDLRKLRVRVEGLNGTSVKSGGAAAQWSSQFIDQEMPILIAEVGSQTSLGSKFHFKAPPSAQASAPLIKATLHSYECVLAHNSTSDAVDLDPPRGIFSAAISNR